MIIYWAIFTVLAAGALLSQEQKGGPSRAMFIMLAALPTALMIGVRWKIGPDWAPYADQYNYTKLFSLSHCLSLADPGYFGLYWLLHQFSAPFYVVNIICGCVLSAGLTAFCWRQPNPWLAFLTAFPYLVIVVGMSGNRQSLALGFLFFALNAFERRKLIRFFVWMGIAGLFHGSVLLMLPVCLMSYTTNGLQKAVLLVILVLLGAYFFHESFDVYARRYSAENIQSTGVAYRLAMNGLAAVLFLAFHRRFDLDEHERKLWRNMSLGTAALGLLLAIIPSSTAVDRFLLYLFPLQFFVFARIPKVVGRDRKTSGQFTLSLIAYAALVQVVFLFFGTFASYYVPYRTIFAT